ncbi:ABC transporter permease [Catelliglobosispora koreensis]|uniref:ABC transporter permease n=1 Tax=Catelliglobosispora koreensis TaxID=129052 RepID=UPI00035C6659|nr:ABC transporter permease [Catelliglobosispora koreensis]
MRVLRLIGIGTLMHFKTMSRGLFEIATGLIVPIIQATMAVYLLRAGDEPQNMVKAAVGAGLMGIWSSVIFGSGGAIQRQRWQGTLEMMVIAPRPLALSVLPVTIATGLQGLYTMAATLGWGWLLFGIVPDFSHPLLFLVAVPACVIGLGMFGLLLASTFVLMRNANAVCNTLEYPIWLLSGMLVPLTVLPDWTNPFAAILPTTWGARAVHEAASGGAVWPSVAACLAISAACFAAGALMMSYVERRARASATLALS